MLFLLFFVLFTCIDDSQPPSLPSFEEIVESPISNENNLPSDECDTSDSSDVEKSTGKMCNIMIARSTQNLTTGRD